MGVKWPSEHSDVVAAVCKMAADPDRGWNVLLLALLGPSHWVRGGGANDPRPVLRVKQRTWRPRC
jgi:hypothetical protein